MAWTMGAPGRESVTVAVAGRRIAVRYAGEPWRVGWYATGGDAESRAVELTNRLEGNGLALTGGPVPYTATADDHGPAIDTALETTSP